MGIYFKYKKCIFGNPTDYKYLKRVSTLKAMAIVSETQTGKVNTKIEPTFFDRPFKIFDYIIDAVQWASEILEN